MKVEEIRNQIPNSKKFIYKEVIVMFGIFSNKKATAAVKVNPYQYELEQVRPSIISKAHEEELEKLLKATPRNTQEEFKLYEQVIDLKERVVEYSRKFSHILSRAESKEYWVRYFVGNKGENGKWGIQNSADLGGMYALVGVKDEYGNVAPFRVEIGTDRKTKRICLRFTCMDPWDEGTELNIREEIDSLHLPFEITCC